MNAIKDAVDKVTGHHHAHAHASHATSAATYNNAAAGVPLGTHGVTNGTTHVHSGGPNLLDKAKKAIANVTHANHGTKTTAVHGSHGVASHAVGNRHAVGASHISASGRPNMFQKVGNFVQNKLRRGGGGNSLAHSNRNVAAADWRLQPGEVPVNIVQGGLRH